MTRDSNNLLRDPLISTRFDGNPVQRLSLPELLAQLLADAPFVMEFTELTPWQRGHWHRFLVRCATQVLHEAGEDGQRPYDQVWETWNAERLATGLEEAAGSATAWALHEPDFTKPAFLQPPAPAADAAKSYSARPISYLTSLIGSKMHERKVPEHSSLTPAEAVFGLVELQLGSIFGGRGNYGTQLLGSASGKGSGSPFMSTSLPSASDTFRLNVNVLLDEWERIRENHGVEGDVWALWTLPWDGSNQLAAMELTPAFVPLARMVRLGEPSDGMYEKVLFRASRVSRVLDHTDGGGLGDIFLPLVPNPRVDGAWKVRGTMDTGYRFWEVARLLGAGSEDRPGRPAPVVTAAARTLRADAEAVIEIEGTAFEQGKTLGFHRFRAPLPPDHRRLLLDRSDELRAAHASMLSQVQAAQSALRGAARIALTGEPRPKEGDRDRVELGAALLEDDVDAVYLSRLFEVAGGERSEASWTHWLAERAFARLPDVLNVIPIPLSENFGRRVGAERFLRAKLRKMKEEAGVPIHGAV